MERRFHSPYRHWVRGLVVEVAVLGAFIAALAVLAVLASWLVR